MEYPRIPSGNYRRPTVQECTEFRGVLRKPVGVLGRWWDERNLTSARYPRMAVRPARVQVTTLDGNPITNRIVAACGGDHIVLLDETGTFWCNGHSQHVTYDEWSYGLYWFISVDKENAGGDVHVTVTPQTGVDATFRQFNGLCLDESNNIVKNVIRFRCKSDDPPAAEWECDFGSEHSYEDCDLADYNISATGDNYLDGVKLVLHQMKVRVNILNGGHKLVRMGSKVIDAQSGVWIDAVALANGTTMVEGTHYGRLGSDDLWNAATLTLTMCNEKGEAFNGVVVSATEPTQTGYWLDISGEPELRQWSAAQTMWVSVSNTFVRMTVATNDIRAGDTISLSVSGYASTTDQDVVDLLNSDHFIYNMIPGSTWPDIVISGILKSDTVTVTAADLRLGIEVARRIPQMDYVVECDNRLWGCRYDEIAGVNELYACKLGDPTNWYVYQGLATDSWAASRGKAAPFTGAAVLDGCPLFFREESVEKIYPASGGGHTVKTFDLPGIAAGSADSAVVIDGTLYYHGRDGVYRYNGTIPVKVSDALGDLMFTGASAARRLRTYCVSMQMQGGDRVVGVYDLESGDWHLETEAWTELAVTFEDGVYYVTDGKMYKMSGDNSEGVEWYAETGTITYVPEHKWLSYMLIRARLEQDAECRVYIRYDGGPWERKGRIYGNSLRSREVVIWPRRCDSFRLRFEGKGGCEIQSIAYRLERSVGGR